MSAVLVIMNNYFHDLATGVLFASGALLWWFARRARGGDADLAVLARAYPALSRLAVGALVWIVVGGVPRLVFFSRYEWDPAVVGGLVPALVVKHVLYGAAVVAGVVLWRRAARMLGEREEST